MAEDRAFGSSGGTVPLRRGRGIEVRVDGISVTVDDGPDEGAAAILKGTALVVGRGSGNDVALTDPAVAPRHLVLTRTPEGVMAEDLGSPGGTFLGGLRIRQAFVPDGGTVRVGTTVLTVRTATTRFVVEPLAAPRIPGLVGESAALRATCALVHQLARTDLPVTVIGETGTGKELIGRALHAGGPRAERPFLVLDCGSVVPALLRSEIFGHAKGAFTGADTRRRGLLEEASGGTLFLDEVGELELAVQPQLLRALESRRITPLGSREPLDVDFRVVSATNRDLRARVEAGAFRADLLYRLAAVTIRLPPLRERREDIPALVEHFAAEYAVRLGVTPVRFAPGAFELLAAQSWPGNVRELKNTVQSACALAGDAPVDVAALTRRGALEPVPAATSGTLAEIEAGALAAALEATSWNRRAAARRLGISPTTLLKLIKHHGLEPASRRRAT